MANQFELTVLSGGDYKLEVVGGQDSSCLNKSGPIEQVLGTVTNRELQPEAFVEPVSAQTEKAQQSISM